MNDSMLFSLPLPGCRPNRWLLSDPSLLWPCMPCTSTSESWNTKPWALQEQSSCTMLSQPCYPSSTLNSSTWCTEKCSLRDPDGHNALCKDESDDESTPTSCCHWFGQYPHWPHGSTLHLSTPAFRIPWWFGMWQLRIRFLWNLSTP